MRLSHRVNAQGYGIEPCGLPQTCKFENVTEMQKYEDYRFFPELSGKVFLCKVIKSKLAFSS